MPGIQFTDNQSVDATISQADDKAIVRYVSSCIDASNSHKNKFANLTGSYTQDAEKFESLYNGVLYSERKKLPYECKADEYAYYVDFDAMLMSQLDYKTFVKQVDESGETVNDKDALDALSMERLLKACHQKNHSDEKEEDMLRIRGIYGNAFYAFQPYEEDGQAWPGHTVIKPQYIGISPGATDIDDAVYVYYRRPVPTSELRDAYPEWGELIRPDVDVSSDVSPGLSTIPHKAGFGDSVVKLATNAIGSIFGKKSHGEQTWLTTFYYKDPAKTKIQNEQELSEWVSRNPGFGSGVFLDRAIQDNLSFFAKSGGQPFETKEYPHGRVFQIACDMKLEDYHNPYPFFPIVNVKCYRRPCEPWAKGVIEKVREPIQNKQLISGKMAGSLDMRLRPTWIYSGPGVPSLKKIKHAENEVVQIGTGKLEALPVPPVATQDVTQASEIRRRDAEMVAGLESVLGGVNPANTTSGVQYEKILEQAMGKVAPRFREVNRGRKKIGDFYLWFIENYMQDERKLEYLSEAEEQKYLTINKPVVRDGQNAIEQDVTKAKYHFYIDVGLNRPISKAERFRQISIAAESISKLDPIEGARLMLEGMDFPGRNEVLLRFENAVRKFETTQQQQAQQQSQMAQQKQAVELNIKERAMDVKEVKAGADIQTSQAAIVTSLSKVGIPPPQELMDNIGAADATNMVGLMGDEVGR